MKKLAKTSVKVTGSMQVSSNTVAVPEIPRDRRLIRNAATVNEMPKPTRRYIKTTKRAIETAKTNRGLKKLTRNTSIYLRQNTYPHHLQKLNPRKTSKDPFWVYVLNFSPTNQGYNRMDEEPKALVLYEAWKIILSDKI